MYISIYLYVQFSFNAKVVTVCKSVWPYENLLFLKLIFFPNEELLGNKVLRNDYKNVGVPSVVE